MSKRWGIQEVVDHGDIHKVRHIITDLSAESVEVMLNECSYLRLPEFDADAVLTSRTQEEVLAQRSADAARVAKELAEVGTSQLGWVTYRVCQKVHAPLFQLAGFDQKTIAEAFS